MRPTGMSLRASASALDELRRRLDATLLPPFVGTRSDESSRLLAASWEEGPPVDYVADLLHTWRHDYDWRRLETSLEDHGRNIARVDGLDIEFLHVRSTRLDASPLVISHGWPSSIIEPLQVLDLLANPRDPSLPAFHVVAPSLPGFGFSGKPSGAGWTTRRTASAWADLMASLGYAEFLAAGGDWGGRVTAALGTHHPDKVAGIHTFTPYVAEPLTGDGDLSPKEARWLAETRHFWRFGSGYSLEQSTKPQTVAYALLDSPVAQLTWILEKLHSWTDNSGDVESAVTRDQILDIATFYWLSRTGGSSARYYWANFPPERNEKVDVPTAITIFPADIEKLPRSWIETRFRDIRYWSEPRRGGHFPMLEVPDSYVSELQTGFRALNLHS